MFNNKYEITAAVLQGRKAQTRRNSCQCKVVEVIAIAQSDKDCVDECLIEAEKIIEQEENYINRI